MARPDFSAARDLADDALSQQSLYDPPIVVETDPASPLPIMELHEGGLSKPPPVDAPETEDPAPIVDHLAESGLALRDPTVGDVDRLWDWIRSDDAVTQRDFNVATSVELHEKMRILARSVADGQAVMHALSWRGDHVGFATIHPILGSIGLAHLYLRPASRGQGVWIARSLLREAATRYPTLDLAITTEDPRVERFARRAGFTQTQYFVLRPRAEEETDG